MTCATCGAVATHGSVFVTTTSRIRGLVKMSSACLKCELEYLAFCAATPPGTAAIQAGKAGQQ